jgi:DNA-binding CsgD family transcriptional regulator
MAVRADDRGQAEFFVVDGHALIAVPLGVGETADGAKDRRLVAGRITCAGTEYVVYDAHETAGEADERPAEILTQRELQIASLIGDGKSDKEIAQQLGISIYTVREYIRRVFAKLKIGRRAAVVSYVLKQHDKPGRTATR